MKRFLNLKLLVRCISIAFTIMLLLVSVSESGSILPSPGCIKTFFGTIRNDIPIQMKIELHYGSNELSGRYLYKKYGKNIRIKGNVDDKGDFIIKEFGEYANTYTGVFKGKFLSPKLMEGIWTSPNGDKSFNFFFRTKNRHRT